MKPVDFPPREVLPTSLLETRDCTRGLLGESFGRFALHVAVATRALCYQPTLLAAVAERQWMYYAEDKENRSAEQNTITRWWARESFGQSSLVN